MVYHDQRLGLKLGSYSSILITRVVLAEKPRVMVVLSSSIVRCTKDGIVLEFKREVSLLMCGYYESCRSLVSCVCRSVRTYL